MLPDLFNSMPSVEISELSTVEVSLVVVVVVVDLGNALKSVILVVPFNASSNQDGVDNAKGLPVGCVVIVGILMFVI